MAFIKNIIRIILFYFENTVVPNLPGNLVLWENLRSLSYKDLKSECRREDAETRSCLRMEPRARPPAPPTQSSTGESKSTTTSTTSSRRPRPRPCEDDRPLRSSGPGRTFASGRSSYNLGFVDWENEWETHVEDELSDGGYEVEESVNNDVDDASGVNWVQEYREFWESVDAVTTPSSSSSSSSTSSSTSSSSSSSSQEKDHSTTPLLSTARIERLHHAIEERGGLPPLRAIELRTCYVHERQEWLDSAETNGTVTCGICLETIDMSDQVFTFCHPFHVTCIRPWFIRSHECPLCRGDLLKF